MESATLAGWQCPCGWFNKPGWIVCPGCERQRDAVVNGQFDPPRRQPAQAYAPPVAQSQGAFGYSQAAPKRRSAGKVVLSVVLALAGLVAGRVAWTQLDNRVLHPDRARAIADLQQLNKRTPPPAAEKAAYDALGRLLVAPGKPYREFSKLDAGAVTPAALAATSKGVVTEAQIDAAGVRRAWVALWMTADNRRAVLTWLHEFADSKNMTRRVEAQVNAWSMTTKVGTSTLDMPAGIVGRVTDAKITGGGYGLVAVCHAGPRMATVIMVVTNRPGNKEFDWLRALAVRQQAALSTPQDVVS